MHRPRICSMLPRRNHDGSVSGDKGTGCTLCSEPFGRVTLDKMRTTRTDYVMVTPCFHEFHTDCIKDAQANDPAQMGWCPNCRRQVNQYWSFHSKELEPTTLEPLLKDEKLVESRERAALAEGELQTLQETYVALALEMDQLKSGLQTLPHGHASAQDTAVGSSEVFGGADMDPPATVHSTARSSDTDDDSTPEYKVVRYELASMTPRSAPSAIGRAESAIGSKARDESAQAALVPVDSSTPHTSAHSSSARAESADNSGSALGSLAMSQEVKSVLDNFVQRVEMKWREAKKVADAELKAAEEAKKAAEVKAESFRLELEIVTSKSREFAKSLETEKEAAMEALRIAELKHNIAETALDEIQRDLEAANAKSKESEAFFEKLGRDCSMFAKGQFGRHVTRPSQGPPTLLAQNWNGAEGAPQGPMGRWFDARHSEQQRRHVPRILNRAPKRPHEN